MFKLITLLALLSLAFSLEGVVELTDQNFKEQVYSEPKFWLVMFSASWVPNHLCSADIAPISNQKYKK